MSMTTKIVKIDRESLTEAKEILSRGGLVAFPTETVYGLGANALDDDAVRQIYRVKGRPQDNPLIVHVHKDFDISSLADDIPDYARRLAEAYLPGPLTMVYKSKGKVSPVVSCGLDTVGIRVPSHRGAEEFLKFVDMPIAAPSANISKHVSPVTAEHVYKDFCGKIPLILDGGKSDGGIESTVLDCTGNIPCILRSGLVTREMIAAVAGDCALFVPKEGERVRSPGMKYKHYSPNCNTMLFGAGKYAEAADEYRRQRAAGVKAYVMCDLTCSRALGGAVAPDHMLLLGEGGREIASNLYYKLREGESKAELIIAVTPEGNDGVMAGVMNRLTKACGGTE